MIDGVKLAPLITHRDQRGFFREIFRFSESDSELSVGQLSHSLVEQGVVKGWHGHVYQSQWNYVVTGRIRVGLYDHREVSPTHNTPMEFLVGDGEQPLAYFFPPGVMHGYECVAGPLHIIYVTSGVYDPEDELRIPLDDLPHPSFSQARGASEGPGNPPVAS